MAHDNIIDNSVQELADYFIDIVNDDSVNKPAAMAKLFEDYSDYLKSNIVKASTTDTLRGSREEDDDDKLTGKLRMMVDALIVAAPTLDRQTAAHFLLHSPHGRRLAEHLNNLSKKETPMNRSEETQQMRKFVKNTPGGMSAVAKRIIETGSTSLDEMEYTTLVQEAASLNKISFEKAFADPATQRAYKIVREAGYLKSLVAIAPDSYPQLEKRKTTASMTPTFTEVGDTNVADDSAEAVRLLQEMAEQSGKSFEVVFSAPENKKLAARTYRAEQRPNESSTKWI